MNTRLVRCIVAVAFATGAAALVTEQVSTAQSPAKAQMPVKTTYKAPRTPDGQPDLQGFWTNETDVPLMRPANVTKEFYTPEELAERDRRAAERAAARANGATPVHYSDKEFGLDKTPGLAPRSLRTSMIFDPPNGQLPALSPEGEKRHAAYAAMRKSMGGRWDAAQNNELDDRCISAPSAGPPMLPYAYNSNYQIVQNKGYVLIVTEMMHHVRLIPLDNRARPPADVHALTGFSRARWEGDTLVVETTNLAQETLFGGVDLDGGIDRPQPFRGASDRVKVTEWLTRLGENEIQYRFKVEDPTTWTSSWSAEISMSKMANGMLFEHACHEGNFGLYNTLVGARMADKDTGNKPK